jgi:hypothetical protein
MPHGWATADKRLMPTSVRVGGPRSVMYGLFTFDLLVVSYDLVAAAFALVG